MLLLIWLYLVSHFSFDRVEAATIEIPIEEDTYIEEKYPSIAPWNNRNLFLGTDIWYAKGKTRILIKPQFSLLASQDILPSDIQKVELFLTSYDYEGSNSAVTIDSYTTTTPWSMFDATWASQPLISVKRDGTLGISTSNGQKNISVTNAFIDAYKSFPGISKGIELKINAETEKAMIFWAHGCDIAPTPPICSSINERPKIVISYTQNRPPTVCAIKTPSNNSFSNLTTITIGPLLSSDLENDPLTYQGKICSTIDCTSIIWEGNLAVGTKTTTDLHDGDFFIMCKTNDGHQTSNWGEPIKITVDTIPPVPPIIVQEPPITASQSNSIYWYPNSEEGIEYQLLTSEREDFRSYNTYSTWTPSTSLSISHTKEKLFYYKVRARDRAGNVSNWSEITSTTIDTSYPTIKYFKSNRVIVSPKVNKDGNIEENAYIQVGIDEENIESIVVKVTSQNGNVVFSQTEKSKAYLWTHWPDKNDYSDGIYAIESVINDSAGHSIQSNPLFITVDTKPPNAARVSGITNGAIYKTPSRSVQVQCNANEITTVYLSGKIIASGNKVQIFKISKSDGSYTLEATCQDNAGNKSQRTVRFSIDTMPPAQSSLAYVYNELDKTLTLKLYCREQEQIRFYKSGVQIGKGSCEKNTYASSVVEKDLKTPYFASFTAIASDTVGNERATEEKTVYIAAKSNSQNKQETVTCTAIFLLDTKSVRDFSCSIPTNQLFSYLHTEQNNVNQYSSVISIASVKSGTLHLTIHGCKQKSFWDPRTWFGCVEESRAETVTDVKITPVITSKEKLFNVDSRHIAISHSKKNELEISYRWNFAFSTQTGANHVNSSYTTEHKIQTITPQYEGVHFTPYFYWIFSNPVQVSQWHGNTAFEKPHGGIDFSVGNKIISSPAEGKVTAVGYHKASACFSGGYYIGIKHPNGLFTYYFHLKSTVFPNGKNIKIGTETKKGTPLAITGQSGMYNCEPLQAHLHFEVRTSNIPSSHINPVPYMQIDWNNITTAKAYKFPGRLTGDNPHPKF